MEYMTLVCVTYKDGTPTKKAIYAADSPDSAVKGVHTNMAQYMAADNVASVMAIAANSIGGIYKNEYWIAPVEPKPETEVAS